MLTLVACLIGQFAPGELPSPKFEDLRAVCQELKREQIAYERDLLEQMKPTSKPSLVPLSKSDKRRLLDDIKVKETELKRLEKDEKLLPLPQVILQTMRVGQIGELYSRVNYTDTSTANQTGDKVAIERIETAPAKLTVVKTFRPKAIVCSCDGIEVVLLHFKGQAPRNGETIEPNGIYRASGRYTVAGKTFLAIEQWDHNTEWQKKIKRPDPSGRIQVVSPPTAPLPPRS